MRLGRRIRVSVAEHSHNAITVGRHCVVGDDVFVALRGGELAVGEQVTVKDRCRFEVAGRITIAGPGLLQHGVSVHCDESVSIGPEVVLSEHVTVVDSAHGTGESETWFVHVVRTAPIIIETRSWIGAKATVARGVHVGEGSVVSANSLVVDDVPARALVSGVPAVVVRDLGGSGTARDATAGSGAEP